MTPSRMLRPALVCLTALATSSCGMVEGDPHRFEGLAQRVADIRLDGSSDAPQGRRASGETAARQGLRPAFASTGDGRLKVEVMDPHDLWDARDVGLRGAVQQVGSRAAEAAAPVVAQAVAQSVSAHIAGAAPMRPAIAVASSSTHEARTTIQLGAFSTPQAARSAWTDVSSGAARGALKGLSPVFEAVQVNGRPFTRLKVAAPAATAIAICRAADVHDPWCARRT